MDIVRNGELEATNYFFGVGDQESVLELTYNHDGRTYDLGTATATSPSASTIWTRPSCGGVQPLGMEGLSHWVAQTADRSRRG